MLKNKLKNQEEMYSSTDPEVIEFEREEQRQKNEEQTLLTQNIQTEQSKKKTESGSKKAKMKVAVASFVFLLAVGIGGNWYYENSGIAGKIEPILDSAQTKTLGEAEFVDATTQMNNESEYFASARVERQTARDESLEKLQAVIDKTDSTQEANTKATEEIAKISNYISIENKVETLVTAKGVNNCLAVISADGTRIDVIADVQDLNEQIIVQIKDIAMEQLGCSFENVSIIQSK